MSQSFFRFKQFTIRQERCAMKVCTDACLFGALLPATRNAIRALDIGGGTGLLSLMFAQKNKKAQIEAVEMDEETFLQMRDNFSASPWQNRLFSHHKKIQEFAGQTNQKYEVIFSNPPFFGNDLKSPDKRRSNAMHDDSLTLAELAVIASQLLADDGRFFVLLPYSRADYFTEYAEKAGLFLQVKYLIKDAAGKPFFRAVLSFGTRSPLATIKEIRIKEKEKYSSRFTELLKDYYLYL